MCLFVCLVELFSLSSTENRGVLDGGVKNQDCLDRKYGQVFICRERLCSNGKQTVLQHGGLAETE